MVVGRRAAGLHHCNDSQETLTSRRAVTGRFSAFHVQVFSSGDGGRPGQSDRRERSSDDSRGVEQGGGDDLRAVGQVRNPLLVLAADSASGDEEIRPQQVLEGGRELGRPLPPTPCSSSPFFPSPTTPLDARLPCRRPRGGRTRCWATELRCADTADPIPVPKVKRITTPEVSLPAPNESSAIPAASASLRTVTSRPPRALPNERGRVGVDPGLVDVRGAARDAAGHDSGQRDADRPGPLGLLDDLGHSARDRIGSGRLRGQDLDAVTDHFPGAQVDRAALDAAAADVDPETCGCHRPALLSVEFEVTIYRCKH